VTTGNEYLMQQTMTKRYNKMEKNPNHKRVLGRLEAKLKYKKVN